MIANALATAVDFITASVVVYLALAHASVATALGSMVGALVSFTVSRVWAFEASGAVLPQMLRYAFVSLTTAGLNAGLVAVLVLVELPFVSSWVIARAIVFCAWSYPLQRGFVFER